MPEFEIVPANGAIPEPEREGDGVAVWRSHDPHWTPVTFVIVGPQSQIDAEVAELLSWAIENNFMAGEHLRGMYGAGNEVVKGAVRRAVSGYPGYEAEIMDEIVSPPDHQADRQNPPGLAPGLAIEPPRLAGD